MIKIKIFTQEEEKKEKFANEDLADAYLLDHMRGFLSLNKKSFAIIEQNKQIKFAIIKNNCLEKINFEDFILKLIN